MRVIYEPKGAAAEYGELAVNLYNGCGHGCIYCYAPRVLHMKPGEFYNHPVPRKDVIKKFRKDCEELAAAGETRPIFLCFTCDPYQPLEDEYHLTKQAIEILNEFGLKYRILTKAEGHRVIGDFLIMDPELCELGVTLVFSSEEDSRKYEPCAGTTAERCALLATAKVAGFKTWVSLEPVWNPNDTLELIRRIHNRVDVFKIGKLNHHRHAKEIDWPKFRNDVTELCEELGVNYVLKKDLLEAKR